MCSAEHNLPDSPFASPTKAAAFARGPFAPTEAEISAAAASTGCNAAYIGIGNGARNGTNHLLPPALDIPSPKPYFFPMSRYAQHYLHGIYFPFNIANCRMYLVYHD
jgi:hypothetical protein